MANATILILDSFGIGSTPDADKFGDEGSNTFAHIAEYFQKELNRPLNIPNLTKLGLVEAGLEASGTKAPSSPDNNTDFIGAWGHARELSSGKDTPSGHWEIAGVPVLFDWGYFDNKPECFPEEFLTALKEKTGVKGTLGHCHASGTEIIKRLGEEHVKTGFPICYTSADSVFQVAAHEDTFGLDNLYAFCEAARELLDDMNIGRVIARPFTGSGPEDYKRTGNRRDYSVLPPAPTVLDKLADKNGEVISIGKISDIYAHQGITQKHKATGLEALINTTLDVKKSSGDNTIIFTNLVDFDQEYGHRRNTEGYGLALEYFDTRLPEIFDTMADDDLLILSADHGCDPTWHGTEHTREYIPVLVYGKHITAGSLGERQTFADIGQTLAEYFDLEPMAYGESFLNKL